MFIHFGKVTSAWCKEPPVMTIREELNSDLTRK